MNKLNFIFPMLVGVLAFVNFLWMMNIPYRDLALISFFVSILCIGIALIEKDKNCHH